MTTVATMATPVLGSLADTFATPLMRRALLEVLMAGVLAGVVGVHVVVRRLSFFTMSLTHATFPGLVLAELAGVSLLAGTAAFGLVVVVLITALARVDPLNPSTATGVVLAGGFALGVVLISSQPGFSRDLTAFLVGSILTVQPVDLLTTAIVGAVVLAVLALFHKELVLGAFDRGATAAMGYRVLVLDLVLLVAVELTVVTSLPAMGTILSVALIVGPAATARLWTDRIRTSMALASGIGAGSGVIGLVISRAWDVAAGATIALVIGVVFGLSWMLSPRHGLIAARRTSRERTRPDDSGAMPPAAASIQT